MAKSSDWGRWEDAIAGDGYYIIGASEGDAGSGKTHFWLTAPAPIAWFGFDPDGLRGLREQDEFRDKVIKAINYNEDLNLGKMDKGDRVQASLDALERFKEDWDIAARKARTLIIDKESMLWEMLRYAHDEVESPDPKNFHELHMLYAGWMSDAMNKKVNVGFIRDIRDTWGKTGVSGQGKAQWGYTGKMAPEGNKKLRGLVHVALGHRYDAEEEMFAVKVGSFDPPKCRLGGAKKHLGKEFYNPTFTDLARKFYPESEASDWEDD